MSESRYASRKFVLACAAFLSGVVFFAFGMLTAPEWISFTQWVLGLYLAANIGDQVTTK